MTKQIGLIVFISFLALIQLQAQGGKKGRIESMRVAFMTNELDLSTKESQAFWPLYNEMQRELRAVRSQIRQNRIGLSEKSDKQKETVLMKEFDLREKIIGIDRKYFLKYKKVIPVSKIAKIRSAETAFKKELLKIRQGRQGPRRRN